MADSTEQSGHHLDPSPPKPSQEVAANDSRSGLIQVTEGYYKYTDVLFDWPKCLSLWQRNAVKALLSGEVLVLDDHPLHIPGQQGIELYRGTAANGHQKLLFSLKQLEYLQYYIHEHKLSDPKVVKEMMGGEDAGWPEDFDFGAVVDEGRLPLPLNILLPKDLGEIKPINFTSMAGMKKELTRIGKHNKSVKREEMLMRPASRQKTEAELDNEREGPGLRKGPMKPRRYDWAADDNNSIPSSQADSWAGVSQISLPHPETVSVSTSPEASVPPSPDLTDSLNLSTSPSLLETYEPDTPAEHYHHAQQALLLASQGGLVAALHGQAENPPEGEPSKDEEKIGRSLFVALDVVTHEEDVSVVLEIGWSALWWQPVKPGDGKGEFEEMRNRGHYVVQNHLLSRRNGQIKPDHRDKYSFGSSLPIQSDDVCSTMTRLMSDLLKKAGGGPTYVVLYLPRLADTEGAAVMPSKLADLLKIGLFPTEWHQSLRPTSTQYPFYSEVRGIGRTSIIDAAVLLEHIRSRDGAKKDAAENYNDAPLVNVAAELFPTGDDRAPKYLGNAGNSASCILDVMLCLLTEHDPPSPEPAVPPIESDDSKLDISSVEGACVDHHKESKKEVPKRPIDLSTGGFVEVKEHDSDASHESDSDSEAGGIQGVYFQDDEGEMVEFDDDE